MFRYFGLILILVPCSLGGLWGQTSEQEVEFLGDYESLEPDQRRLVMDWFDRYNQVTGENVDPQEGYDSLPLSVRTTFEAVTHALLTTELTTEDGESLGTALQRVAKLETVRGKVKGAGGDRQFRIYVQLEPGTREILEKSEQFKRGHDNTVYHKGYPLNYRQQGGVPAMQISMSMDEKRADIDVDYRSSKFPVALFNGHLSSSNSDIRAGNNHGLHVNRWMGLENWWESWIALPFVTKDDEKSYDEEAIPDKPKQGRGEIHEAAYDFLKTWLVDRKPQLSMAYLSNRVFECMALETEGDADPGMITFKMLVEMRKTNEAVGEVSDLSEATIGIRVAEEGLRTVISPYHSNFVLYRVSEAEALAFDCANRTMSVAEMPEGAEDNYKDYFGTIFYLNSPHGKGETLSLLWTKESGYWKIISYEVEPETDVSEIPDVRVAAAPVPLTRIKGDPGFVDQSTEFMETWLVKKDIDRAFSNFATQGLFCCNLFLIEDEEFAENAREAGILVRDGLKDISNELGTPKSLEEVVEGVEPANPDIQVIEHSNEDAFVLLSVPDYVGKQFECQFRLDNRAALNRPEQPTYGNYYALGVRARMVSGDPGALYLLWKQVDGQMKIVAFHLETP